MTFEVKEIEFESSSDWDKVARHKIINKFAKTATKYVPKIESITKIDCQEEKTILKFSKSISLITICKILSQMNKNYSFIEIEEIEYKPEDKRVEVEVK